MVVLVLVFGLSHYHQVRKGLGHQGVAVRYWQVVDVERLRRQVTVCHLVFCGMHLVVANGSVVCFQVIMYVLVHNLSEGLFRRIEELQHITFAFEAEVCALDALLEASIHHVQLLCFPSVKCFLSTFDFLGKTS